MATIAFVSLGCDKNAIDSEIMLSLLTRAGHRITKEEGEAEAIIINTCSFISDAKEESINTIIEMGEWKTAGKLKALIVAGCLAQRYAQEIQELLPEVDGIVGCGSYESIVSVVEEALANADASPAKDNPSPAVGVPSGSKAASPDTSLPCVALADPSLRDLSKTDRIIITPGYYEYLKIAEGCDNHCTYCVIPSLRGRFRSRKEADLLEEARMLAKAGVKELNLVAQDITKYGRDLQPPTGLPQLLRQLCAVEGIQWIRLLYCYPEDITDELLAVMAEEPKILHYLDMPIQHCHDGILKKMGRRHTRALLESTLQRIRSAIPDIALRTTLITGFPGETREAFEEMVDFIQQSRFDRLGVFAYSREEGTGAARMRNQIPEEEKERRKEILMETQRRISAQLSEAMIGKELEVLVEGRLPSEDSDQGYVYTTRTYKDAPEIDGFLFLSTNRELSSGDMVKARVVMSHEYDLIGEG